jgi:UDP-N-acetylmuramate: L-alanyl-gamma-D-glutamyl-meso-diaminopimelate ligase
VAGTHGKTTTTSMLTWILEYAGLKPGFLIGGVANDFGVSAKLGNTKGDVSQHGSPFVIEADEYDTAFFDKRSKFVHYRPRTLVLNNLEYDHADIFPDVAAIRRQFHHVVRTVPSTGRIICNGTDLELADTLQMGCWSGRELFGVEQGWHFVGDEHVDFGGERFGDLRLAMPGAHNRQNALAAIAAARHIGVHPTKAIEALAKFSGVRRRLELRGEAGGVRVYDDFAHHPTAFAATVSTMRKAAATGERVIAVFEPRSNTMKLGAMRSRLAESFIDADRIYAYSGGVDWNVLDALAALGPRTTDHKNIDALARAIALEAKPGDHIVVMSNGGFGGLHEKLLQRLKGGAD